MAKLMKHNGCAKYSDKGKQPGGNDVDHDLSKTSLRGVWLVVKRGAAVTVQSGGAASDWFARKALDKRTGCGARGSIGIKNRIKVGGWTRLMLAHHAFDHPRNIGQGDALFNEGAHRFFIGRIHSAGNVPPIF